MKKEIVKKIFNCFYSETEIKNIEIIPKNKFENGKWFTDNPAVFLKIKKNGNVDRVVCHEMSETLTKFTGCEFDVSFDFVSYFN